MIYLILKIVKVKFALILRSQDFPMLYQNLKKVKLKIFFTNPKLLLNLVNLIFLKRKHYNNLRGYGRNFNICNIDTSLTNQNNVKCEYLPNTWPDFLEKKF